MDAMNSKEQKKKGILKLIFIFLCVITLAVLVIDIYLFWENIQIEKKIQSLILEIEK
jgi:hypothetical protein